MGLLNSCPLSRDGHYSGGCREGQIFRLRGCHPVSPDFPDRSTGTDLCNSLIGSRFRPGNSHDTAYATERTLARTRFRLFPVRSPLLRESRFFLFLWLLRCFSCPRSLPYPMDSGTDAGASSSGFPHSEIPGSARLAAPRGLSQPYCVLHRLLAPEHPPCTLNVLTTEFSLVDSGKALW